MGGPAIDSKYTLYRRKQIVQDAIKESQQLPLADIPAAPFPMGKEFHGRPGAPAALYEEEIQAVLHKMGKDFVRDERNCEGCGYDSCRAKAIAVLDGMATMEMCVPYMRSKAESMAHTVMEKHPQRYFGAGSGNDDPEFNPAAQNMLKEVPLMNGLAIGEFMDVSLYEESFRTKKNLYDQRVEYPQWI